ncbi:MAG: hypothetical protein ABF747_01535 [Bifidobacterium sp.]|uniref:Tripartite tricarboxylate transporter TctB family protein n=2 Tax=Bifidobacterium TaxID=1678 RepID=A0AB39UH13_9BIFI
MTNNDNQHAKDIDNDRHEGSIGDERTAGQANDSSDTQPIGRLASESDTSYDDRQNDITFRISTVTAEEDTAEEDTVKENTVKAAADKDATANEEKTRPTQEQDAAEPMRANPLDADPSHAQDVPLYASIASEGEERDAYGNRIIHKKGASAPTIVLGSILIVCGVLGLLTSSYWAPLNMVASLGIDWRIVAAIAFAAVGGILLLSSLSWLISTAIHHFIR